MATAEGSPDAASVSSWEAASGAWLRNSFPDLFHEIRSGLRCRQSFTRGALTDGFARASVEMSVRLAKEMGLKIVAEGVEAIDMRTFLADLGIAEAQG